MGRAHGLCGRCSGPIRGRSARRAHAVTDCAECDTALCASHAGFDADNDRYLCGKCARKLNVTVVTSGG
ncbi:hypothetical protein GCM10023196_036950 [Actinoallomurus vinaceus]|uniref:Uncharacterized protein n=1 Tax=Actinoallomurus vinaceus TaxID=1080074 RepID=A0ABP8UBY5_9ACTN